MHKVTAIIPCKNEAHNIEAVLQSVSWCSEIMVVDSFSADNTVELAKKYTSRIIESEYINSASQKNRAIPLAQSEWILLVDADFSMEYSAEDKMIEDEITMIRIRELAQVIELLPRRQKECIYLRFYEGMTYQEISDIMDIEVSSVYKMIYKAIEKLYENLAMKNGNLFL